SLGGLALFIEILNPGLIFPGVFGAIALVLAFVSFGNLPVNYAGVGLILFALVLFFFEIQVAGVGILGVGGLVSFILGSIFLFAPFAADPPSISSPRVSVSPWLIGGVSGGFGGAIGLLSYLAWRGKRTFQPTAESRLVGQTGRVTQALDPVGTVRVAGQLWSAEEENGLTVEQGERVDVVAVDGLTLKVVKRPKLLTEGQAHGLPSGLDGDEDEA
ncbi:MAG: NfeD family protein, partial [Dehalococcoidia bacterium]